VTLPAPEATALTRGALEERITALAYGLGFDLVGLASLGPAETASKFDDWLQRGFAAEMSYLERGAAKRRDTRLPFAGARSAVVVALDYGGKAPPGPVARYARGGDYHDVMESRLRELHKEINSLVRRTIAGKPYVDTGPVLERDLARRAGLGWFGKNTMLIHPKRGSFFFLGALLLDLELAPDSPFDVERCGHCTRCLDACPTGALVEPGVLDSRKCISYLTIELRGTIPFELSEKIGELIYGCDICQEVCPWNVRFATAVSDASPFAPREALVGKDARTLARDLLGMSQPDFSTAFKGSPMKRAKLRGLKRNAAVVLENVGTADDIALLERVSDEEPDEALREHVARALTRRRELSE
jgi:epoxyqueuosine reductase